MNWDFFLNLYPPYCLKQPLRKHHIKNTLCLVFMFCLQRTMRLHSKVHHWKAPKSPCGHRFCQKPCALNVSIPATVDSWSPSSRRVNVTRRVRGPRKGLLGHMSGACAQRRSAPLRPGFVPSVGSVCGWGTFSPWQMRTCRTISDFPNSIGCRVKWWTEVWNSSSTFSPEISTILYCSGVPWSCSSSLHVHPSPEGCAHLLSSWPPFRSSGFFGSSRGSFFPQHWESRKKVRTSLSPIPVRAACKWKFSVHLWKY